MHPITREKKRNYCINSSARFSVGSSMAMMGLLFVAIFVAAPQIANAAADPKVTICHFPPGNPSNYQTITISSSALKAHLAHGDFGGACANDCNLFSNVCDDGNLCTTDICNNDGTCSHVPVNCNDGNSCTDDSCNPTTGCVNTPVVGRTCDDQNACTSNDQCTASGGCAGTPIAGCCLSDSDCNDNDKCTTDTCNLSTHQCANTQKNCPFVDACTSNTCAPDDGTCQQAPISCDDHNACTDDSCDAALGCQHTPIAGCCRSNADCASGQNCDIPTGNSTGTCVASCATPGSISLPGQCGPSAGFWGAGSWSGMASITVCIFGPKTGPLGICTNYLTQSGTIGPFQNPNITGSDSNNFSGYGEVDASGTDQCGLPRSASETYPGGCP